MLLIYPPSAKPSEPPAGLARLAGALRAHGVKCSLLDANLETTLSILASSTPSADDRWTARAYRSSQSHLTYLRSRRALGNRDRYKRAVLDLNRLLEKSPHPAGIHLSLANYQDDRLSPVRSEDLLRAAESPEENAFYSYFRSRLLAVMEDERPSMVGISLNYLSQALTAFAMAGFLKRECPGVKIIAGGGLITSWMRKPDWRNPFAGLLDHMVAGPGESDLLGMLKIEENSSRHFSPDYSTLLPGEYLSPGPILPYSASSGCYWNRCAFCPERAEGNPYTPIPVDTATAEIRKIAEETSPVLLHLLDNAISPKLMRALCQSPPGVPWYGFARVTPHLADPDFCRALRESGCVMLKLGLESADQNVLDHESKGMKPDLASETLKALKDAGISTYVYLLFGTPSETVTEARRTLQFTAEHHELIDFLNLALFNLPIHSEEAGKLKTELHYQGDLSLYTGFSHPKGWDRALVRQFLDREFKRHPAIAAILRNDPPIFTSNHAPFFCAGFKYSSK